MSAKPADFMNCVMSAGGYIETIGREDRCSMLRHEKKAPVFNVGSSEEYQGRKRA
jgi:hypothetical protein